MIPPQRFHVDLIRTARIKIALLTLNPLTIYVVAVFLLGLVIGLVGVVVLLSTPSETRLFFIALLLVGFLSSAVDSNTWAIKPSKLTLNFTTIVTISTIPFLPAPCAALVNGLAEVVGDSRRSGIVSGYTWFNFGARTITMFVAATFYQSMAVLFEWPLPTEMALVFLYVVTWAITATLEATLSLALVSGAVWLKHHSVNTLLHDAHLPLMVSSTALGGALLAYAISKMGLWAVPFFVIPVVPSIYAYRTILAENVRLEGVVAERTAQLEDSISDLERTGQLKTEFLANMSHELRTPLNTIIGFSDVILFDLDAATESNTPADLTAVHDGVTRIWRNGKHLLAIINNILDMAKIEAGKMELAFDSHEPHAIVAEVVNLFAGHPKGKPIEFFHTCPQNLPPLWVDNGRVIQILLNLLSNAAKFTDTTITLDVQQGQGCVLFSVGDNGEGIPEGEEPKLWNKYEQVGQVRHPGTGLGLPISKELAKAMGGDIEVQSITGQGAVFILRLPVGK